MRARARGILGGLLLCALLGACLDDLDVRGTAFVCLSDDDCLSGCACVLDGTLPSEGGLPRGVCRCEEADAVEPSPDGCAGACGGCEEGTVCLEGACTPLCVAACPPGSGLAAFDGCRCPTMPAQSAFDPPADGVTTCAASGQRWAATLSEGLGHAAAMAHCQGLGPAWRLPTVREIVGALDLSAPCQTGAGVAEGACEEVWVWSQDAPDDTTAWALDLDALSLKASTLGAGARAWCVQDRDEAVVAPRFVRTSSGPALDRVTGLLWRADVAWDGCDWPTALASCEALGGGWRLPELKELFSLTGEGLASACELEGPFDWLARCDASPWAWSSTPSPDPSGPQAALGLSLSDGALSARPSSDAGVAICVK